MTTETWNTFLDVMNKSKNVAVIDLTKKEEEENESLVNQFDTLFYEFEDLDIQTSYLRAILRLLPNNTLKELITKIKIDVKNKE
jgi:hypothetical protein